MTLLRDRIEKAVKANRGLGLNRSEIQLVAALIMLAVDEFTHEEITHAITEQEDATDRS
jgi:hypothetical protein